MTGLATASPSTHSSIRPWTTASAPSARRLNAPTMREFVERNSDGFEINEDDTAEESAAGDYSITEDIFAIYGMARVDIDAWRFLGGIRIEATDFEAVGTRTIFDEVDNDGSPVFEPVRADNDYTDVLPSINVRYEQNPQTIWRGSLTTSVVRPNFSFVAPTQLIEIEEDDGEIERKAELGNPDLDPLTATNFDIGVEFYPGGIGVVSAGFFYKDIQDFVVLADVADFNPDFSGFDEAIQPINGDDAEVFGIELGFVRKMDFLQYPWDGLLVSANYTYVDSEATLPGRVGTIPLPRTSENVGNFAIGYEQGPWSLRIALTYRDAYLDAIEELDDPAFDRYADAHTQIDLSAKYRINPNFQVYFEAINVNDEPFFAYFGEPRFLSQYEEYGWTAQLGVARQLLIARWDARASCWAPSCWACHCW